MSLMSVRYNDGSNISKLEKRNTKDLPGSGRPKLWFIDIISRVLEENSQESTRRLSEEFSASKVTIHRHTKTLGKS